MKGKTKCVGLLRMDTYASLIRHPVIHSFIHGVKSIGVTQTATCCCTRHTEVLHIQCNFRVSKQASRDSSVVCDPDYNNTITYRNTRIAITLSLIHI